MFLEILIVFLTCCFHFSTAGPRFNVMFLMLGLVIFTNKED